MVNGASLHMMSKHELTSGQKEKDTIIRSEESTVTTTAKGKAESMEEATENVARRWVPEAGV